MSAYSKAPYGFGFAADPFEPFIGDPDSDLQNEPEDGEQPKEPRYNYGAMHSAIKRNREWFR
ncbi:hypothetical protein HJG53_07130 [Sphingomonas sp. ID1715]|uniref:hypothetical protein n=1 Tax=Sphingomonas sp. ID1715 TaxID=1656898 RepID=UPI0014887468|nr:hypothetical protein [Sphingomonas sp. ID1715]NNM76670.1 hypothetical protein [Sphingomonas sp. ID1715]